VTVINWPNRERRPLVSRIIVVLTVLSVMITSAFAVTQIVKGTATPQITQQSTGIYTVAGLHRDVRPLSSLALFYKGQMKEIHTKVVGGTYLHRKPGSTPIRIQPTTFDQLIAIAGGVDKNVEQLPPDKKNRFYQLAGLSSTPGSPSAPPPPEVAPDAAGHCPPGYELRPLPKPGKCVLKAEAPQLDRQWLAAAWERLDLVRQAEAAIHEINFSLANIFGNIAFSYNDQERVYRFQGFGFTVVWDDNPSPPAGG
jgi:hypothetical protein